MATSRAFSWIQALTEWDCCMSEGFYLIERSSPAVSNACQTKPIQQMLYRPDIDGLRAVAVLLVLGFHAFPNAVTGGFVGVDVFFVISGFLITNTILTDVNKGAFSLWSFYARRARRIFPALIAVLAFTLVSGWLFLFAQEYKLVGKHVAAGAAFVSNLVAWTEAGYFDRDADTKPLLRLWSLGIEEQFYLFWPLLLLFVSKPGKSVPFKIKLVLSVFLASFSANILQSYVYTDAAYYSPFGRLWELMAGAMLALLKANYFGKSIPWPPVDGAFGHLASGLGLILIGYSALQITPSTMFPGWWATAPVIGAILIISAEEVAWPNRFILSSRGMVLVGLISYPLYLWHWPVLSFASLINGQNTPIGARLSLLIFSGLLAVVTYKYIEMPIRFVKRTGPYRDTRGFFVGLIKTKPLLLAVPLALIGAFGYWIYENEGVVSGNPVRREEVAALDDNQIFERLAAKTFDCLPQELRPISFRYGGILECRQLLQEPALPTVAIIGDSHAEHLFIGLANNALVGNYMYYTQRCLPFLGLRRLGKPDCENMQKAIEYIVASATIHTVVLSAKWPYRAFESDFRFIEDSSDQNSETIFKRSLSRTIGALRAAGKTVVFAFSVPFVGVYVSTCYGPVPFLRTRGACGVDYEEVIKREEAYRRLVEETLANYPEVRRWDPRGLLCENGVCPVMRGGKFIYRDNYDHLTDYGSGLLAKSLDATIQ
jgi:peptidoglycan/LPS O-acetylase OafA/YrhL